MTNHSAEPYRKMTPRELVRAYLAYRATARRSHGRDLDWDVERYRLVESVAQERGLIDLLVRGMAAMRSCGWQRTADEVALEVCGEAAA